MSTRTTLKPGDLLYWTSPDPETVEPSLLLVSQQGDELLFQFAPKPWSQMKFKSIHGTVIEGYTAREAEEVLRGEKPFELEGRIYKAYDAETDTSYPDPEL